jgi:hypothetical protein
MYFTVILWYNYRMESLGPEVAQPRHFDAYPSPEDWDALQGGKPRVFRNPNKPDSVWLVVHVYEQHDDPQERFKSGAIVPTIPPHLSHSGRLELSHKSITRKNWEGDTVRRDISLPSFMDRTIHGDVCEDRSKGVHGNEYDRITSQETYDAFLQRLKAQGYEELRFGVNNDGFTITPLEYIAPSKPLSS